MNWYQIRDGRITLSLHIQPNAKRTEVAGLHGDALKIRIAAAAVDGAANAELLGFLKKAFQVPQSSITLKHGASGRRKVVEIEGSAVAPETLLAGR
jgi:uncharacterized protein (TIGR00251 family)